MRGSVAEPGTLTTPAQNALLLGAAGVACIATALSDRVSSSSRLGWRGASAAALAINILGVSVPGRFDSDPAVLSASPWPTIFSPAGFAFAIWGVIYLGECLGLVLLYLGSPSESLERAVTASNDAWLAANVAQSLWCAAFRPWALSKLWLSSLLLGCTAACLCAAQARAISAAAHDIKDEPLSLTERLLVLAPRSLHLGWVTAATLVNLNAWVGYTRAGPDAALGAAVLSIVVAALAATAYAAIGATSGALAVAWALHALSYGTPVGADAAALGAATMEGVARAEASVAALIAMGLCAMSAAPLLPQFR